jgi:hypothetical protein
MADKAKRTGIRGEHRIRGHRNNVGGRESNLRRRPCLSGVAYGLQYEVTANPKSGPPPAPAIGWGSHVMENQLLAECLSPI